jgi:hypothetical protein
LMFSFLNQVKFMCTCYRWKWNVWQCTSRLIIFRMCHAVCPLLQTSHCYMNKETFSYELIRRNLIVSSYIEFSFSKTHLGLSD